MEIQGLKTTATEIDNLLLRMANSFFSGLMWVKGSQEELSGRWNDHDYTCMAVIQLNVVGTDLLLDNLDRAVQYIKSSQHTPGIFAPDSGGGEPTLTSTCLAIWGLYSSHQSLSPNDLKQSLKFMEYWTSKMKWKSAYAAYTTLAALGAIESVGERLTEQGAKVKRRAVEWITSDSNWRLGAWISEESLQPRDITRNTAVALLALEKANERLDSLLVSCAIASLEESSNDQEIWNHNRTAAWILKALVYWGYNLESDIVRTGISRLIDNQNDDDGSWGDTKSSKANAIHTTRVLEVFSLLFQRHHINQSYFEALRPYLKTEHLIRRIEDQVAFKVNAQVKSFELKSHDIDEENRRLKLRVNLLSVILGGASVVLAILGIVLGVNL